MFLDAKNGLNVDTPKLYPNSPGVNKKAEPATQTPRTVIAAMTERACVGERNPIRAESQTIRCIDVYVVAATMAP